MDGHSTTNQDSQQKKLSVRRSRWPRGRFPAAPQALLRTPEKLQTLLGILQKHSLISQMMEIRQIRLWAHIWNDASIGFLLGIVNDCPLKRKTSVESHTAEGVARDETQIGTNIGQWKYINGWGHSWLLS
jgi:hypothetical protein